MTRGFVTIATGNNHFYRIAAALLRSYRAFTADPMPFALICDRENEYSAKFDQTVILADPAFSYIDKLRLAECVPFDETIFIDADSLAYRDLNDLWAVFENAPDFSALGQNYPADYQYAWFKREDVGEFSDRVKFIPDFIGGIYFLRRSPYLKEFSETCMYILKHYKDFRFRQFSDPADEPIVALAMAVNGCGTVPDSSFPVCFYPHCMHFKADIGHGHLSYDSRYHKEYGMVSSGYLVHWGSGNTRRPVYLLEEYRLRRKQIGRPAGGLQSAAMKMYFRIKYNGRRVIRKLRRIIGLKA